MGILKKNKETKKTKEGNREITSCQTDEKNNNSQFAFNFRGKIKREVFEFFGAQRDCEGFKAR